MEKKLINESNLSIDPVSYLETEMVKVKVLRLDKIHPVISGNKWYKLKFYIEAAIAQNKKGILTFGGAYSNHIVATAAACNALGIESIGIIRGEAPKHYSPSLLEALQHNMKLIFLSREDFKNKQLPPIPDIENYFTVAEGGYGILGANGAATIPYPADDFDMICCATGTGTMMAGLLNGSTKPLPVLGFSVLKNNFSIENEIRTLLKNPDTAFTIQHDFHFGGYAKYKPELIHFMNELYEQSGIPTDFVYTAKLFYGVKKLVEQHYFKAGSKLLLIHSGGLQGNRSLGKGTLIY